jgi:hypothetical protein
MRVQTQFGLTDINPADVISIKPVSLCVNNAGPDELTYCVEYKDHSAAYARSMVCVTEPVAKELSRASGVEIPERKVISKKSSDTIFVPFKELLVLDEWEKYFYDCVEKGICPAPEPKPAPFSSYDTTLYEENHQPVSLIEQAFRAQNNCIQCGKFMRQ